MKKMNSILMGRKKIPSNSYGIKSLMIPCLILALSLTALTSKAVPTNVVFTDPYVQTTVAWAWTDLDGVEYQDVWVDFFDEFYAPVVVYGVTLNYYVNILPNNININMTPQYLSGSNLFLIEDNAIALVPGTGVGNPTLYYNYYLSPGTGYNL